MSFKHVGINKNGAAAPFLLRIRKIYLDFKMDMAADLFGLKSIDRL